MEDTSILKIKCGDILRRIAVKRGYHYSKAGEWRVSMTFSRLEETVRHAFKIPATSELALVYTDVEHDEVTMTSDDDIRDACIFQKLNPVRITVVAKESHRPAHDDRSPESLAGDSPSCAESASDPPAWAADISLKLDQLLLAVNKEVVEPGVGSVILKSTIAEHHILKEVDKEDASPGVKSVIAKSTTTVHHVLEEEEDASPIGGSTMEWTDIGQPEYDPEFLRRVMILRQRDTTDELDD